MSAKNSVIEAAIVAKIEPRGKRDYPLHVVQVDVSGHTHVICDCYAVPGLGTNKDVAELILEALKATIPRVKLTEERETPTV